jgi:protein SCO1/2
MAEVKQRREPGPAALAGRSLRASHLCLCLVLVTSIWNACSRKPQKPTASATKAGTNISVFAAKGIVRDVQPAQHLIVIQHEAIPEYMAAMTMPFKVKENRHLRGIQTGDAVSFRLWVTPCESWVDNIQQLSTNPAVTNALPTLQSPVPTPESTNSAAHHPLRDYKFTNELSLAVSLNDFRGQALAINFIFTRCPIPEFCPRMTKNFEEATAKLTANPDAPTNYHFLSVSFDSQYDSPEILRSYAERYHYDPRHWSFLTGPADKISEFARLSDVTFKPDGIFFEHNFRTVIVDATGKLQTIIPVTGDLSDSIVREMMKAATAVSNP